jgi:hypothetical protein
VMLFHTSFSRRLEKQSFPRAAKAW